MALIKLTQQFVNNPPTCSEKRKIDYYDITETGLLLEVRKTGTCTFYLRYQNPEGKTRQMKLGSSLDLSLDQARQMSREIRTELTSKSSSKKSNRSGMTLRDFVERKYMPYIIHRKRSYKHDQSALANKVLPLWGNLNLSQITQQDVIEFHGQFVEDGLKPATANRYLKLVKYVFNLAVKWELLDKSPATGVQNFEENNLIERYLSQEETCRLIKSVKLCPSPVIPDIIEFLIYTGARRSEAVHATWAEIDFNNSLWKIALSKSGKARFVPLSTFAIEILRRRQRLCDQNAPYIFANPTTGLPFVYIFGCWDRIRKKAGLADVRMHDLRHNFASVLINAGRSLYEVQKILGHADTKTTERYAHLSQDRLKEAVNLAGQNIMVGQHAA